MNHFISISSILTIVLCMSIQPPLMGQHRTAGQAMQIARQYLSSHQAQSSASLSLMSTSGHKKLKAVRKGEKPLSRTPYYIYADTLLGQMVIVSGDERMPEVLGYSSQAYGTDLPAPLVDLLECYKQEYSSLPDSSSEVQPSQPEEEWGTKVLTTMEWSQEKPFRSLCPEEMPSGCVATALGIVMSYHRWPLHGRGKHAYTWQGTPISANFHESSYDWSKMGISNFNLTHATDEEKAEVAKFIKDICTSVETNYRPSGSSASMANALVALKYYFQYSFKTRLENSAGHTQESWEATLRKEIDEGRPFIYTAYEGNSGHAFVIDGYSGHKFHANFGWGGHFNGFYELNDMMGYSEKPQIIAGIAPATTHTYAIPTINGTSEELSNQLGADKVEAGKWCTVNVSNFYAYHTWEGTMQLGLYDAKGELREVLESFDYASRTTRSDIGTNSYTFNPSITAEAGDYLAFAARQDGEDEWFEVCSNSGDAMHINACPSLSTGIGGVGGSLASDVLLPGHSLKAGGNQASFTLTHDATVQVFTQEGKLVSSQSLSKGRHILPLPTHMVCLLKAE